MNPHSDPNLPALTQSDQIRALLAEIDELLDGGSNSFIWRFSGDRVRHRQTLEHLRSYLNKLQYTIKARSTSDELPLLLRSDSPNPFAIDEYDAFDDSSELAPTEADAEMDATELEVRPLGYQDSEGLLDQLGLELSQLRESLLGPLQKEVEQLRNERNALQTEVTALKIERAQNGPFQEVLLRQFLETLMGRLQERLVKQVSQVLQEALPRIIASQAAALPPAETQEVEQLQKRANGLLSNMDSTLRVFSQTLEQNIQAYQQSLSVGLERMHSMGREGEVMMSALVNQLAEQMERQTALYLSPTTATTDIAHPHVAQDAVQGKLTSASISRSIAHQDSSLTSKISEPEINELDRFYAGFEGGAAVTLNPQPSNPQSYSRLEEALFGDVLESENAWLEAWKEGEADSEEGKKREEKEDIIHSLTGLVSRTFEDLQELDWPNASRLDSSPAKKKLQPRRQFSSHIRQPNRRDRSPLSA